MRESWPGRTQKQTQSGHDFDLTGPDRQPALVGTLEEFDGQRKSEQCLHSFNAPNFKGFLRQVVNLMGLFKIYEYIWGTDNILCYILYYAVYYIYFNQ